jgi:hypothetical protein
LRLCLSTSVASMSNVADSAGWCGCMKSSNARFTRHRPRSSSVTAGLNALPAAAVATDRSWKRPHVDLDRGGATVLPLRSKLTPAEEDVRTGSRPRVGSYWSTGPGPPRATRSGVPEAEVDEAFRTAAWRPKAMPKDYRFRSALSVKSYNSIPDGMCRP